MWRKTLRLEDFKKKTKEVFSFYYPFLEKDQKLSPGLVHGFII